jgi:hypothetical protein
MLVKQNKLVKLHLESFCFGNLVHFQLEQRNSNQSGTRFEQTKKYLLGSIEQSGVADIFNLTHALHSTLIMVFT